MTEIRKVMCCCGQGLGSSMMVEMNIQKALKKLGRTRSAPMSSAEKAILKMKPVIFTTPPSW